MSEIRRPKSTRDIWNYKYYRIRKNLVDCSKPHSSLSQYFFSICHFLASFKPVASPPSRVSNSPGYALSQRHALLHA